MNIDFIRNIQFTRLLKAGGRQREFNFRKLRQQAMPLFSVDVVNERGERIQFHLQKQDTEWKLVETGLPSWIQECEPDMHQLLDVY